MTESPNQTRGEKAGWAVEIVDLNKWYGDFHVLRDINLTVSRGERIVICGPSGGGKSTMIRCVNRLEDWQRGRVIVDGKELGKLDSDDELPPIPPYVDDWTVISVHAITEPVTLHGLTPHLHLRGKSMKYTLIYPDGREEILLSVPKYDFNWQVYYELETPKHITAGSKVIVTTLFDNSLKNRYNPAPDKEVFWSEQSWDEMYAPQARITVDSRTLRATKVGTEQQRDR